MPKFGIFDGEKCIAEYDDHYYEQNLRFVVIFKIGAAKDEGDLVVSAFRLEDHQHIKAIE
jgi:hypothetical protein